MPAQPVSGQPERIAWHAGEAGAALLASEADAVTRALVERSGHPWLWLSPAPQPRPQDCGRGLQLCRDGEGWRGDVACAWPLPLARESVATIVCQHASGRSAHAAAVLEECMRVLMPGGRLWLFALNPLSPFRRHWAGQDLAMAEPVTWRRRMRACGLQPEAVSRGIGPRWRIAVDAQLQDGAGLRAAYLLRAEKRTLPLTPLRQAAPARLAADPAA